MQNADHPAGHFLIVDDENDVMTWHLLYKDAAGNIDIDLLGAAWASLMHPNGFRGNRYQGPGRSKAIVKLRAAYHAIGRKPPDERRNPRRSGKGESLPIYAQFTPHVTESEFRGTAWDVTIIGAESPEAVVRASGKEYVRSKNGRLYSCEGLAASAPRWDGVKVYDNHLTNEEFQARAGMRSVKEEWVGGLTESRWVPAASRLDSILKIVDLSLASKLKIAYEEGVLGQIGLSIDTLPQLADAPVLYEGTELPAIEGFQQIISVDLVAEPAAGGRLNRILASVGATPQQEDEMNEEEIRALVEESVSQAVAGLAPAIQEAVTAAMPAQQGNTQEQVEELPPEEQIETAGVEDTPEEDTETVDRQTEALAQLERRVELAEARVYLQARLSQPDVANLSEASHQLIHDQFDDQVFDHDRLESFIAKLRAAVVATDPSGRIVGAGTTRTSVVESVFDQADKWAVAFMQRIMWDSDFRSFEHAEDPAVKDRIPEFYASWIKAGRPNIPAPSSMRDLVISIMGGNPLDPRASESIAVATLTSITKNTINLMLANDYSQRERWWDPIVRTEVVNTIEDATLVRVYGLSTLSEVAEGGAYTELTAADEEETASYYKRGNFVGITIEALMKDRLNHLRTLPKRLADSWWNTLSDLVSAVFTTNTAAGPVLSDTGALFNATAIASAGGHVNLLTAALDFTSFGAARLAMRKQTDEPLGAGRKLLIEPKFCLVPVDLETTAETIFQTERLPGSADNDINPHRGRCQVITVPPWTDTNDWALVADKRQWPAIWMLMLSGMRTPAIFTAGDESSGAMFTNDVLRYKVRQIAFRYSSTYDCAPISDFRPLHKSNV
jgi:hypothetical protein